MRTGGDDGFVGFIVDKTVELVAFNTLRFPPLNEVLFNEFNDDFGDEGATFVSVVVPLVKSLNIDDELSVLVFFSFDPVTNDAHPLVFFVVVVVVVAVVVVVVPLLFVEELDEFNGFAE